MSSSLQYLGPKSLKARASDRAKSRLVFHLVSGTPGASSKCKNTLKTETDVCKHERVQDARDNIFTFCGKVNCDILLLLNVGRV